MQTLTLLLELALIIALGAVWWFARRDLLMLVTRQQTPTLREMESVQASIEQLLERLEARTEETEIRIETRPPDVPQGRDTAPRHVSLPNALRADLPEPKPEAGTMVPSETDAAARYAEVHRLAGEGLDAGEIARRTGLGSAEVRLVINLAPKPPAQRP